MSRKHYEMLAGVIRPQVDNARDIRGIEEASGQGTRASAHIAATLEPMAYSLVQHLYADNARFDHHRFYEACGFKVVDNYPKVF